MAADSQLKLVENREIPPQFCQYADGACDQDFGTSRKSDALFLYPSDPEQISHTIQSAAEQLRLVAGDKQWMTWKDLGITGQIIFCEVCKAIRFTKLVIADVTTLNFNLLFEVGYAIGLGVPVLPVRDTSFKRDQKVFDELGMLDTLGYFDFQNSNDLVEGILPRQGAAPLALHLPPLNTSAPLYVVKSPVENDGMVKLMSIVKKSGLKFRTFDTKEVPRMSLHETYKQTLSSRAAILHLLSPDRGEEAHNARCAFMAGLAMAAQKHVLMLQESDVRQPIDYRDVARSYTRASQIQDLVVPILRAVIEELQPTQFVPTALPLKPLETIDLGDLAAENEIRGLGSYFVPTAQFHEAKRGHARLVVGRKGAGKTALFYGIRLTYRPSKSHLVLDLKPEGHQFIKLREAVLCQLSEGVQQHVLTAFWNYLLVMELALQILKYDSALANRDLRLREPFSRIREIYGPEDDAEQGDFSERLLKLVDDIVERRKSLEKVSTTAQITQLIHGENIRELNDALADYLSIGKRDVWLLFDNLDKGWPVRAAQPADILLLRSLLEATRKLQRQLETRGIDLHSIVFVRNDIYEHLILEPADRGKDTAVSLDSDDPEFFKEILERRISQSTKIERPFSELWPLFFTSYVRGEPSFDYMLRRTLMRPREVLRFVREAVNVAINRGVDRVGEEEILAAERNYSDDALVDITLEMKDVRPEYADVPYAFIGAKPNLSRREVEVLLSDVGISPQTAGAVIDLLLWFGFLGIYVKEDDERYSHQYGHSIKIMLAGLTTYGYSIHPGFRQALNVKEDS